MARATKWSAMAMARSFIRFQRIAVSLLLLHFVMKIRLGEVFKNILPSLISAMVMALMGLGLQQIHSGIFWQVASVVLCVEAVYRFPPEDVVCRECPL